MAKFCRFCGKPVKENAKFCENCGKSLAKASAAPVPPVCPRCGEPLAPDVVFCGNCGLNLQQGTGYASAVPEPTVSENWQQDWNPAQNQQQGWAPQQPQGREYPQQQGWAQPQPQPGPNVRESVQAKRQGRSVSSLLEGFGSSKMLMAAAAAVILLVVGITGFWKPGFLRSSSSKLENGMLALNDIALDFKQTNLKNGAATLATVKDTEEEVQSGLIGNLYVIDVDKNCQGKVTITIPVPKDFKPTTGNGRYIKLGIGRDYILDNGKTARYYSYFDTTIKDGKVVATIDPAALANSQLRRKASAKPVEKKEPDVGKFTEYVGYFFKEGFWKYGEGYQYSKGHFRLWYDYHLTRFGKNTYITAGEAEKILNDFEEAYNYYKTHGYAKHVDTFTPIDVYITRSWKLFTKGEGTEGTWDPTTGNIELNEVKIFGSNYDNRYEGEVRTKTKATIYHEFFHAVQQSLIGSWDYTTNSTNSNWFDEATGTHFEKLAKSGAGSDFSDNLSDNGRTHFWRLWERPIPKGTSMEDGYSRGVLIDYISSKLGNDAWIKDCYEHWSKDYSKLKSYMNKIAPTDADFSAKFYLDVVTKNLGTNTPVGYYNACITPNKDQGEDRYLSAIRMELDKQTKERIAKDEKNSRPISISFTSEPFALDGYGGRLVGLISQEVINKKKVYLTESFPDRCQLKLVGPEGCRIQLIAFKAGSDKVITSSGNVIKDFKAQTVNNNFLYLVLVTSTKPTKQEVVLQATLSKDGKKEGNFRSTDVGRRLFQTELERNEQRIKKEGNWVKLK